MNRIKPSKKSTGLAWPKLIIDPAYSEELKRAATKGIEIIAYDVYIDIETISLNKKIPSVIDI